MIQQGQVFKPKSERMELGHSAPGVLFNWAAATEDGIKVVDVYESRDKADTLAQEKVGPLVADGKAWTTAHYDELLERMDLGGHSASGVLFHWAAATDEGIKVVDVYESRDQADALAQEKVGPLVAELGLTMPEITEYDIHAYLTPA